MNTVINMMIQNTTDNNRNIVIAFLNDYIKDEKLKSIITPIIEKLNDNNKNLAISFIKEFLTEEKQVKVATKKQSVPQSDKIVPLHKSKSNRNGHKSNKKRKLNDFEKNYIRSKFYSLEGRLYRNDCVQIRLYLNTTKKNPRLSQSGKERSEITPFQVTGFMTYLHKEVAKGEIVFIDMDAYNQHLVLKRTGKDIHRYKKVA